MNAALGDRGRSGFGVGTALVIHGLAAIALLRGKTATWPRPSIAPAVVVEIAAAAVWTPPPPATVQAATHTRRPNPIRAAGAARVAQSNDPPSETAEPAAPINPAFDLSLTSGLSSHEAMDVPTGASAPAQSGPGSQGEQDEQGQQSQQGQQDQQGQQRQQGRSDSAIATGARVLHAVDSESVYPRPPRALGIEGEVEALLDIDDKGAVAAVLITRRAGHGFDEAAEAALKRFRFRPALSRDGRALPSRLPWRYTFVLRD